MWGTLWNWEWFHTNPHKIVEDWTKPSWAPTSYSYTPGGPHFSGHLKGSHNSIYKTIGGPLCIMINDQPQLSICLVWWFAHPKKKTNKYIQIPIPNCWWIPCVKVNFNELTKNPRRWRIWRSFWDKIRYWSVMNRIFGWQNQVRRWCI